MNDYYTLKEILLSLRSEQLNIANKIKQLENMLNSNNQDCSYLEINDCLILNKNKLKISFLLHEKYHLLQQIFNIKNCKYDFDYIISKNNNYHFFYKQIKSKDQDEFNQIIYYFINNKFLNNNFLLIRNDINSRYENYLMIKPFKMSYRGSKIIRTANLDYSAKTDTLSITNNFHNRSYQEVINELLSLKFQRNQFPEYYQNIIDKNDECKKDIVISLDKVYTKSTNFYLNQEKGNYILVKKK